MAAFFRASMKTCPPRCRARKKRLAARYEALARALEKQHAKTQE